MPPLRLALSTIALGIALAADYDPLARDLMRGLVALGADRTFEADHVPAVLSALGLGSDAAPLPARAGPIRFHAPPGRWAATSPFR